MESHLATLAEQAPPQAAGADDPRHRLLQTINIPMATTPATTCCANSPCASAVDPWHRWPPLWRREFVIVMPEADPHVAGMVAERLRPQSRVKFAVSKGTAR
jgi:hypothetical protein